MAASDPDLGARIEALPGMHRVLPALEGLPPTYLVGGALRDLLRGAVTKDLDIAVEGRADTVARELAQRLGGEAEGYEHFGTASVRASDLSLDLATARLERYRRPGALPEVEPATIEEDLSRRDFTVNAMAAALAAGERGRLHDPHGGRADLEAATIRVLHRHSFVDDPTRLLRAVRYEARLGFAMDRDTEALARAAAAEGVSYTVSGKRIGDELLELLALAQRALAALRDAYHPHGFNLGINEGNVAGAAFEDHVHLHVVPRWGGDTNYMPVIGSTRVLPESLKSSYEALTAALDRLGPPGADGGEPGRRAARGGAAKP